MKRHRRSLEIISNINITNLLDTAFILLIAFMIVAPTLKSGIPVTLPKVEAPTMIEDVDDSITITISKSEIESVSDRLYIDEKTRVDLEELEDILKMKREANPDLAVLIRTDSEADAGTFVKVVGVVTRLGIENFDILAESEQKKRSR